MNVHEAPAKINLVLRVGRERPDGYHEVVSLLARIDLVDMLMVAPAARTSVTCPDIPGGDTLVTRALHAFRHAARHGGGFHVGIAKRIPIGAGLGGGSSDAAAALRAANGLVDDPLDEAELTAVAAEIGADVPFFLGPPVAIARGRGDSLHARAGPAAVQPRRRPSGSAADDARRLRRLHAAQPPRAGDPGAGRRSRTSPGSSRTTSRTSPRTSSRAARAARGARRARRPRRRRDGLGIGRVRPVRDLEEAEAAARDLPGAAWARAATLSRT